MIPAPGVRAETTVASAQTRKDCGLYKIGKQAESRCNQQTMGISKKGFYVMEKSDAEHQTKTLEAQTRTSCHNLFQSVVLCRQDRANLHKTSFTNNFIGYFVG